MKLNFSKMHGAGNDFVVIDCVRQSVPLSPGKIRFIADRHRGVGCDQVLLVEPPDHPDADFRYRIYNADGSEAGQCGNGARCFARFVREQRLSGKRELKVQTTSGMMQLKTLEDGRVLADLGTPKFQPIDIPLIADAPRS
jgi:diaminopimelate epimerase